MDNNFVYEELDKLKSRLGKEKLHSLVPLLPMLLNLEGKPYSLKNHFVFEPMFNTYLVPKIIWKTGRQLSKCFSLYDETIRLANGHQIAVKDLSIGDEVLSLNDDLKFVPAKVKDIIFTGEKPVLEVRTRLGAVLNITKDHRLRMFDGYFPAGQMKVGDRLAGVRRGGIFKDIPVNKSRIILTAYMIGDGCCGCISNNKSVPRHPAWSMTGLPNEVMTEFLQLATPLEKQGPKTYHKSNSIAIDIRPHADNQLITWLTEDGLNNKRSHEKFIPAWVFDLSREDTKLFLSRLWATDGLVKSHHGHPNITYCTTSQKLARDVRSLLNKLGMPASIKQRKTGYTKANKHVQCKDAFIVRVETREGQDIFLTEITVPTKPGPVCKIINTNNNRDTVPIEVNKVIKQLSKLVGVTHGKTLHAHNLRKTLKYPLTCGKLSSYIDYFNASAFEDNDDFESLKRLNNSDIFWDEIISIKQLPEVKTCDIEVEHTHNFVMDGIVSHNSTSIAAHGVIMSAAIDRFKTLYITPLYEQIRRLSSNYVQPFIVESPIKGLLVNTKTSKSVLQRSFVNQSIMHFSYALLSADRVRGIRSDKICFDEIQDMCSDFVPVIEETLSASPWAMRQYTGTPKDKANTIEAMWSQSSQAEWLIKCGCGYHNIPSIEYDLLKMIGPYREDISEERPGTVCAKCGSIINPRAGFWLHRNKELRLTFPGYHVPQILLPLHYTNPQKWSELLSKMNGIGSWTPTKFKQEVLGESTDETTRLVSKTDLEKAGILHVNDENIAAAKASMYAKRVMGVDWGGGGEKGVSLTAIAILGILPNGLIDVIYGKKLVTTHDHVAEAKECMRIFSKFSCDLMAHDYTGAGNVRETVMIHIGGLHIDRLMPISYVRAASHNIMNFIPASPQHPRNVWRVDKARSLQLVSYCIKFNKIRFFKYDYINNDRPGLLHDFLALVENKVTTDHGSDIYTIIRDPHAPDDFAQAVNIGCCAMWHATESWPKFADLKYRIDAAGEKALGSFDDSSWELELRMRS